MRWSQFEGAAKGLLGETELDHGPVVPEVGGFGLADGVGKAGGGFDDLTLEEKVSGAVLGSRGLGGHGSEEWEHLGGRGRLEIY